ncbi:MAG: DUF3237 domain-containing protein [Caulobacteraceae bacterium]
MDAPVQPDIRPYGRDDVSDPSLEFVFRIVTTLGAPLDQGTYDGQRHRIIPILGGAVEGPGFKGLVLPGGADWQSVRVEDGVASIHARSTLQHEDGSIVSMTNLGVRRGPPEVMAKLAAGELVDPSEYYFRACPQFEVQPGPHGWLAQNVFLCIGKRWPDSVHLDIFKVL